MKITNNFKLIIMMVMAILVSAVAIASLYNAASEVRASFIQASIEALLFILLFSLVAIAAFFYLHKPLVRQAERQAEIFQTLAKTAREGIFLIDQHGIIQFVNSTAASLFKYQTDELVGKKVNCLMPAFYANKHDQYIANYLSTGIARIIGSGRQVTGKRKNGQHFPIYLSVGDINLSHTRLFAGVVMDLSEQFELQREILEIPLREQRRIGQELHDGLGQQLTGLGMLAKSLSNKTALPEQALASQLNQGLQDALAQLRAISRGMMPVEIDAQGLMHAMQQLAEEVSQQSDIPITLEIDNVIELSDNHIAMHLYRIAQEAINNAVKHASASYIRVTLKHKKNRGLLEVFDNGRGLPADAKNSKGLGLRIMKHRCGMFDGEVMIDGRAHGGTLVRCYFPVDTTLETKA